MIDQRLGALFGWSGTVLFLISWLMIVYISAFSTLLWAALMLASAAMCLYGAIRHSKLFFLPSIIAVIVTAGVFVSASLERAGLPRVEYIKTRFCSPGSG